MAIHDSLGDRMKEYESRNQYYLQKRTPVCIRVDMRAGHTFTRGFTRPFDEIFGNAMARTMEYCAKNIGNCVFAYCQSDEITFILVDYAKLETDAWFDYRTDKLCSIAASMATMAFNRYYADEYEQWYFDHIDFPMEFGCDEVSPADKKLDTAYRKGLMSGAMFDARCFNIPKEEVTNLVYWRQVDAKRNSVQMVGQANYSHSYLQNKTCAEIKELLQHDFGINWDGLPARWKHGCAWTKETGIDYNMPLLKGENRKYLDDLVFVGE